MTRLMLALSLNVAVVQWQPAHAEVTQVDPLERFPTSQLTISTPDMRQHAFNIWVADTPQHSEQGLMFVKSLPEDAGMLFLFNPTRRIAMWMKNTFIPLDMLFINREGVVESIAANTTPFSLDIIQSKGAVNSVLEINGGRAKALGIEPGARVKLAER